MDPDQTVYLYAKSMFEKFARRCSRRNKQMAFSDVVFLGILRVKMCFVRTYQTCFNEVILMSTHDISLFKKIEMSPDLALSGSNYPYLKQIFKGSQTGSSN